MIRFSITELEPLSAIFQIFLPTGPNNYRPATESSTIHTTTFTNSTLICLVDGQLDYDYDCYLEWRFNNKSAPLKSSEKYTVDLKETSSKCKEAFILIIMNVTHNDNGTYSCQMFCEWDEWQNTSASIELKVYEPQIGKKVLFRSILGNGWLVNCSIGWSVCRLVGGWLVGRLIVQFLGLAVG